LVSKFWINSPREIILQGSWEHLKLGDCAASGSVSVSDGSVGAAVIPVVARGNNVGASEIIAGEAPVLGAERTVAVVEVAEVRGDAGIVSDAATREVSEVTAEAMQAGVELLEDHSLGLYFTDLLSNDALGHLLEDKEALLDDLYALGVADELLLLDNLNRAFAEVAVVEVVRAIEVIESTEGRVSSPVIERDGGSANNQAGWCSGGSRDAGEGRNGNNESGGKCSEHDDNDDLKC
jgi:hypothetical protein